MTTTTEDLLTLIPPQNLEAEQVVLGAMLIDVDAILAAAELLNRDDFYRESHRLIYQAIIDLHSHRQPVDLITLGERLRTAGNLDEVGGTLYLSTCMAAVPTAAAIRHYAGIVRDKSLARKLIHAGHEIIARGYQSGGKIADALAESETAIQRITDGREVKPAFESLSDRLKRVYYRQEDAVKDGVTQGWKTGWYAINQMIRPLMPGQLVVVGARPGMGKTAFALNWALSLCEQDAHGMIFSLEMDGDELSLRAALSHMKHTQDDLQDIAFCQNNAAPMQDFNDAIETLWHRRLAINDEPGLTIRQMDAVMRRYRRQYGKPVFFVADYLQLTNPERKSQNRSVDVGDIAQGYKELAKQHGCFGIVLSQLTREVESQPIKRPLLRNFMESGKIEAAADLVMYLYRPGYYGAEELRELGWGQSCENITEFGVLKNRQGVPNRHGLLCFEGEHFRFRDLTQAEYGEMASREK